MDEQIAQRLANLQALQEAGAEAYPYRFEVDSHAAQILQRHAGAAPEMAWPEPVRLAGRVTSFRRMGKITFSHLQDETDNIQLQFSREGTAAYELLKKLDVGDLIGVSGYVLTTKTGEITVKVENYQLLAKSLHPLPDKWHGIKDKQVRYRQRYLDLMISPEVRQVFRIRSRVVSYLREFFNRREFLEVETPVLQALAGGAEARPFITHHHALGQDFSLRIALELALKRLLVGGFERVYELGRVFRNEGIDSEHNPEFTMLECYWAYADYQDMAELVEELLQGLAIEIHGTAEFDYQGRELSLARPFARISFMESLQRAAGIDFDLLDLPLLRTWSRQRHPELAGVPDHKLLDKLFGIYVEPELFQPTFVVDFPELLSPLAKRHRSRAGLVERWDLYIAGLEIAPAYSELNDPLDQRRRFNEQARRREAGDLESNPLDEDFLLALEYGMPPAAGMGIGIDRLAMILANQPSLRDVLLFPLLRREALEAE